MNPASDSACPHRRSRSIPIWRWLCATLLVLGPVAAVAADEPIVKFGKAVQQGDLATVERMLAAGLDPNTRVPGASLGYTPLFLAVGANHPAITAALLKGGADPTIEDDHTNFHTI